MVLRCARRYSDGSFNVSTAIESLEEAKRLLGVSGDDDDTELVQVEIEIVRSFGRPKLEVVGAVEETERLRRALRAMVDRWEPDTSGSDRRLWEEAKAALGEEVP